MLKHNLWIISDEAYRELAYEKGKKHLGIWALTDKDVPGIEAPYQSWKRVSKVWNATSGLHIVPSLPIIGYCATKNLFAEYTANLSANTLSKYIFGAL